MKNREGANKNHKGKIWNSSVIIWQIWVASWRSDRCELGALGTLEFLKIISLQSLILLLGYLSMWATRCKKSHMSSPIAEESNSAENLCDKLWPSGNSIALVIRPWVHCFGTPCILRLSEQILTTLERINISQNCAPLAVGVCHLTKKTKSSACCCADAHSSGLPA